MASGIATRSKQGGQRYNTWNHAVAPGRWKKPKRSTVGVLQLTYEEERGWKADVADSLRSCSVYLSSELRVQHIISSMHL